MDELERAPRRDARTSSPSSSAPPCPSRTPPSFAQWARVHRPDLGVILLRHDVDSDDARAGPAQRHARGRRGARPGRHHHRRAAGPQRRQRDRPDAARTRPRPPRRRAPMAEAAAAAAAAQAEADAPQGKVITVFSTKGGVGKSLVATNLGVALADAGPARLPRRPRRQQRRRGDHAAADPARARSTTWSASTASIDAEARRVDPDHALRQPVRRGRAGAAGLPGPGLGRRTSASCSTRCKRMFDFVVVDTSGVFDDHALTALDRTDTDRPGRHPRHPGAQGPQARDRAPSTCSTSRATRGGSCSTGPTARSA